MWVKLTKTIALRALLAVTALFISSHHSFADKLKIKAEPINHLKKETPETQFGKLEFLGGLVLTSKHDEFGGISGLRFVKDSNFIAVTDKARVITGTLERKDGKPHKIKGERITRIKAANGKTITGAKDKDAESIELAGSQFLVGYERNDRIKRFTLRGRTLIADGGYTVSLKPFGFKENKGPEAIALDPTSGKLFAFAEYSLNTENNHRGFIISNGKVETEISVKQRDGYSLTDAAFLPDGDLLIMERYFNPFVGVFCRIRRIAHTDLFSGKVLDGDVITELDSSHQIDNMEGLAVSILSNKAVRLTLISDDNFNTRKKVQRTVLLEFKLPLAQ